MSQRTRNTLSHLSFPLTAALLTLVLLATFGQALAGDRDEGIKSDEGRYYYDRYARPWVKEYAPPNTAPGTYDEHADDKNAPHGSDDQD